MIEFAVIPKKAMYLALGYWERRHSYKEFCQLEIDHEIQQPKETGIQRNLSNDM